ncbi:HAD family hydrolase [Mariprofundus ferrooxydans]|uniref:FCP1 homology domain-containing protein n=1 Tax=Mariprofundus ferrooxydans PV-1 TaxID=314345 RepID=Q0F1Q7_9PROT|nr:HAD family hydrolase [Mariprofundus ferrooxydans]EAU55134.1 hypothetical protein SPV1_10396 [Mariprofundus ferrooxydans PV-1]KON47579.1 hypothetical protein AL013_07540 [Mariprofundus ferrooxydans]
MNNKKLLILDIDETLIHGSQHRLDTEPDAISDWCYLYKRPHVDSFMKFCREHYKVAIWTTASPEHAKLALGAICSPDYPFEFIWTGNRCTQVVDSIGMCDFGGGYHWVKNLKKVKRIGFRLEQTIMVDDTPSMLEKNYGNLIQIEKFLGAQDDHELQRLMPYLLQLKDADNIRKIEKRCWR